MAFYAVFIVFLVCCKNWNYFIFYFQYLQVNDRYHTQTKYNEGNIVMNKEEQVETTCNKGEIFNDT